MPCFVSQKLAALTPRLFDFLIHCLLSCAHYYYQKVNGRLLLWGYYRFTGIWTTGRRQRWNYRRSCEFCVNNECKDKVVFWLTIAGLHIANCSPCPSNNRDYLTEGERSFRLWGTAIFTVFMAWRPQTYDYIDDTAGLAKRDFLCG